MPTLRRSRYLTCFYCGRKTSTRNDGSIRHFDCPDCDATNYLDEITDPPLEATAASIRSDSKPSFGSPASEPSSDVFCSTCLKNQRIFTSSLAQYLPDDPDDPEYEERERNFYRYRKGLEKQYPQVCAQCEPKVLQRITKAGYTAKTDHLRRMIDRSRKERTPTAATSLLGAVGAVGALGRYLWLAAFALQALWHASIMRGLTGQYQVPVLGGAWGRWVLDAVVGRLFSVLPGPERLMKWSITITAASIWWNPFLVQTVRGFTKHLLGFSTWYTYQVIIMLLRILALGIPNISAQEASEVPTQLAAHTFMLGFVFFISRLSLGAIRTDTTPLFASSPKRSLVMPESTPQRARDNEPASMAEILDDVLAAPSAPALDLSPSPIVRPSESATKYTSRYSSPPSATRRPLWEQGNGFEREPATPPSRNPFAAPQEPQGAQYEMEMDWTPTQSKHRAFRSFGSPEEPLRGFGQTPAEGGDRRQFWYKVPPAPTSIAQRALNPPAAARLRKQPPVEQRSPVFGPSFSSQGPATSSEDRHDVAFKEPSFFAETSSDPRNTLSDLFGQAFSISPSRTRTVGGRRGSGVRGSGPTSPPARWGSSSDMALLAVSSMLLIPGYARLVPPEYSSHLALGVCCLTFVVWAKVGLDNLKGLLLWATAATAKRPWILTAAVGSLIGLVELGVAARIAFECYAEDRGLVACRAQGNWFVPVLVLHQLWNAFLGPLVQHKLTGGGIQVRR
ncbi:hypothetical protein RB599_007917 [Gaeumannomyces hyphopodioides]